MNILNLIEADGVKLIRQGKNYRGRCPFHEGKTETSLLVDADAGKYHCFGCDHHGDAIQWLRERRGLSFGEACKVLGHDPGPRKDGPAPAPWAPKEAKVLAAEWQAKARSFLDGAIDCLWSRRGAAMREWLRDKKGLQDATIREACLGLTLAESFEPRGTWGLALSFKDDGAERRQWIPAGLVIPLTIGGAVHRLRIRRSDPGEGARYVIMSGSSSAPMAVNLERAAAVIVESELDGLLLNQEAGDLAGVVAMGSAQAKPDRITHEALTAAAVILVSLDTDDAGARASWHFWPETYGKRARRWPSIKGKDASDARLNGLNLREWIVAGIFGTVERFERFSIMTIDGGLTDGEALKAQIFKLNSRYYPGTNTKGELK